LQLWGFHAECSHRSAPRGSFNWFSDFITYPALACISPPCRSCARQEGCRALSVRNGKPQLLLDVKLGYCTLSFFLDTIQRDSSPCRRFLFLISISLGFALNLKLGRSTLPSQPKISCDHAFPILHKLSALSNGCIRLRFLPRAYKL
jgi:hypothetical protein